MPGGSAGLRQQMLERLAKTNGAPGRDRAALRRTVAPRAEPRLRVTRATILVAAADEIVRLGIQAVLSGEQELVMVADAETVAATLYVATRLRPTIVIVAGPLVDGSALDVCRRLRAAASETRVIILARELEPASVMEGIRAGAAGYFTKGIGRAELCRAVHAVASGEVLIDPASTRALLDGIRRGFTAPVAPDTTPLALQERRVLALVAKGKTNKEIAVDLKLSDKTVKNYLSHAFEKLNVSRRAQAAVLFTQLSGEVRAAS